MEIKSVANPAIASGSTLNNAAGGTTVLPLPGQNKAVTPTAQVGTEQALQPTASIEQLNQALDNINKTMRSLNADLEFSVDADTGRTLIRVTDRETGELLRQMPTKEALEIAKALDRVQGLLIRQQA
jgi:flagellar protein FlaG